MRGFMCLVSVYIINNIRCTDPPSCATFYDTEVKLIYCKPAGTVWSFSSVSYTYSMRYSLQQITAPTQTSLSLPPSLLPFPPTPCLSQPVSSSIPFSCFPRIEGSERRKQGHKNFLQLRRQFKIQ